MPGAGSLQLERICYKMALDDRQATARKQRALFTRHKAKAELCIKRRSFPNFAFENLHWSSTTFLSLSQKPSLFIADVEIYNDKHFGIMPPSLDSQCGTSSSMPAACGKSPKNNSSRLGQKVEEARNNRLACTQGATGDCPASRGWLSTCRGACC